MVKKSIIITIILLALYSAYIYIGKPQQVIQYNSQGNVIRAEEYMYSDSLQQCDLVLGTSMAAKLIRNQLPHNVYSLAGPGLTVYDELQLIKSLHCHPKYVFIEGNSIMSPPKPDFQKYLFAAPNFYRKKYLLCMRDSYQPAGQTFSAVFYPSASMIVHFTKHIFNPLVRVFHKGGVVPVDMAKYYAEAKEKTEFADTVALQKAFDFLKADVTDLAKSGTKVCFFTMPNDSAVYNSFISKKIREYFLNQFQKPAYEIMPFPNIYQYHTTDQIHLDEPGCVKYTAVLSQEIEAIRNRKDE
jgi:hypothetical protein